MYSCTRWWPHPQSGSSGWGCSCVSACREEQTNWVTTLFTPVSRLEVSTLPMKEKQWSHHHVEFSSLNCNLMVPTRKIGETAGSCWELKCSDHWATTSGHATFSIHVGLWGNPSSICRWFILATAPSCSGVCRKRFTNSLFIPEDVGEGKAYHCKGNACSSQDGEDDSEGMIYWHYLLCRDTIVWRFTSWKVESNGRIRGSWCIVCYGEKSTTADDVAVCIACFIVHSHYSRNAGSYCIIKNNHVRDF